MKNILIAICFFLSVSAQAAQLVIRPVEGDEEKIKKTADIKIALPTNKEETVLERKDWKCKAMTMAKDWGVFRCHNSEGLEVSTRFNCNKQKSFDEHQGFRIAKKGDINLTLSIWCE